MADVEMETKQDSSCGGATVSGGNEAMIIDKMVKRAPPLSPIPGIPHKSRRTHSPTPSSAAIPDTTEEATITENGMAEESMRGSVPIEAPSLSPSSRRKSWKRSTIGRRSLPALTNPSQTLCRTISPSLPQQERLEKLMEASMKRALERTQTLLQSTPNASLETFKKQAEDMQPQWWSLAEELRSPRPAQQLSSSKENNPAMQPALEQKRSDIHRLQAEINSWTALLSKHRIKAEALASKVEQGQQSSVTLDTASLSQSSQWQLIQRKPDYHSVLSRQQPALHTIYLVMKTQCNMVRGLLSIEKHSQLVVKVTSRSLAAEEGLLDLSPDLIRDLVAVPFSSS
ncbi:unnamed protein product [Arctogadus glacialis]